MDGFDISPQIVAPVGTKYIALGLIENNTLSLGFDDYTGLADKSGCQFFKLPVNDSYLVSLDVQDTTAELTLMKRIGSVPSKIHFDIHDLDKIAPGQIEKTPSSMILVALPNDWTQMGQAEFSLTRQRVSSLTGRMEVIETAFQILPDTPENLEKTNSDWRYLKYATTNAHYKKLLDFRLALEPGDVQQYRSFMPEKIALDHHIQPGAKLIALEASNQLPPVVNLKLVGLTSELSSYANKVACRVTGRKQSNHVTAAKLAGISDGTK